MESFEGIINLINLIKDDVIDKATLGNITAYKVKNIVRIDIKFDE